MGAIWQTVRVGRRGRSDIEVATADAQGCRS
jgi:hypothetical protein